MDVHKTPPPDLREPRIAPRLLAALAVGAVAGVTVALPAVPTVAAVLVVALALAVIVPLGSAGRRHLAADPPPEPEPTTRLVEVVHVMPAVDTLAVATAVGVYGRHACDAPTGAIPAVTS